MVMNASKSLKLLLVASMPLFVLSCKQNASKTTDDRASWSAEVLTVIHGFDVPECVVHDVRSGSAYVSNIESGPDGYWGDDGKSHLSKIGRDLKLEKHRWLDSSEQFPIHSAKGMCIIGRHLYFTDNTRLMRIDLIDHQKPVLVADGFEKANDLATDGENVWVSDTAAGKVFCVSMDGTKREIPAPPGVNGLTFDEDLLYAVSWDLHEVYQLDVSGDKNPIAFGLADHFVNLDSIEMLSDGSFLVTDFMGNKISTISADRKTVKKIIDTSSPADVGIDRISNRLYVPSFMEGKVTVYKLMQTEE